MPADEHNHRDDFRHQKILHPRRAGHPHHGLSSRAARCAAGGATTRRARPGGRSCCSGREPLHPLRRLRGGLRHRAPSPGTAAAHRHRAELCTLCGACVEACYAEAREIVGREMTVAQVMAEIERDVAFYDESGGGVTFSGGEPLAQPDFLLRAAAGLPGAGDPHRPGYLRLCPLGNAGPHPPATWTCFCTTSS